MKNAMTVIIVVGIVVATLLVMGPFYVLEEGEQALLVRFGQIVGTETTAGLKFKAPLVDNVVTYSKRIQSWDGAPQRVPTKENQFIWVDTTARWRISDPARFYASVNTMDQAFARLDDIVDSTVRTTVAANFLRESVRNSNVINEIARVDAAAGTDADPGLAEIAEFTTVQVKQDDIQKGRRKLSDEMLAAVRQVTPDFGMEVIDVVIRQIRYSDDLTESVYNRMIKERNQIAQAYRSYGEGKKKEWLGRLEHERRSILSRAYEESERIRGTADALAARIYADAYGADPGFFDFWRSIESYRSTLPVFRKTLTTDLDYFRFLYGPNR